MRLDTLYKRNTNPKLYEEREFNTNCGSFALGVDEWYCPYVEDCDIDGYDSYLWQYAESERRDLMEELAREGYTAEEIMEAVIEKDFEFILKTCPWLEPIDEDEIDLKDRVIAYRLSIDMPEDGYEFDADDDTDFHFRVLIDGEWWEKNGGGPVHLVEEDEDDAWVVDEWLAYEGPIRYARFKEER